jgi:aminoglycoside 6'-N-acetyltransferase I
VYRRLIGRSTRACAALWPDDDPDELVAELETLLADPTQVAFVAERGDGRLCGFAEAGVRRFSNATDESPCAFLEGWWVDEDVRRAGVGRALVAAVEDWPRAQRFTEPGSDVPPLFTVRVALGNSWHSATTANPAQYGRPRFVSV